MHAQHARKKLMSVACSAALYFEHAFRKAREIICLRALARSLLVVHHFPSYYFLRRLKLRAQRSEKRPPLSASSTSRGAGSQYSPCSAWNRRMVSSTLGSPTVSA